MKNNTEEEMILARYGALERMRDQGIVPKHQQQSIAAKDTF